MPGPLTIDASVFINAYLSSEEGYATSRELLERVRIETIAVICPTLVLPEVGGTISRATGDAKLAQEFSLTLAKIRSLMWIPLDKTLAELAVDLAARQRLRGSDAVYVATASRYGCVLVTLDGEMHDRSAESIVAKYPADILRTWKKSK